MPRSWSNNRVTDTRSAAQRARNRPSSLTAFTMGLILVGVFFGSLIAYVTIRSVMHPPTEEIQSIKHQPQDE